MPGIADRGTGLWRAIAWAEGSLLLGLAGVGIAAVSTMPSCDSFLHGCPPGESAIGGDTIVWLVASGAALAGGIFMASWTSGWIEARAAVRATVALAAAAAALWLGGWASVGLVDEFLPSVVVAVGVAGTLAIRPSWPRAVIARLVVLAVFVILAVGMASVAGLVILLSLLTLPAMGAVESALRPIESERVG